MSINRLYDTWHRQITQLLAGERITRVRNFTWLIVGIQLSRSVHLSRIAAKLPGSIRLLSWSKRLRRLVDNAALQVAPIYDPVARHWLLIAANSLGQVRLIVDGTRIGLGYHLIMISLAYRQRSLPIAWVWVKAKKGHSLASVQLALLRHVQRLVPVRVGVLLVGDSEFGAIPVLRQLDLWGWGYVLRQTAKHLLQTDAQAAWQAFGQLLSHPGQQAWLPEALLTARHAYPTNLLAYWQPGETEPWLLATNLPSAQLALQAYRRRMWIEIVFTQMTKTDAFPGWASWDHISDLHIFVFDNNPIDEQFYQFPFLLKVCVCQPNLDSLTEIFYRCYQSSQFIVPIHLARKLIFEVFKAMEFVLEIRPSALVLRKRDDTIQVGFCKAV